MTDTIITIPTPPTTDPLAGYGVHEAPDTRTLNILLEVSEKSTKLPKFVIEDMPGEMADHLDRDNLLDTAARCVAMIWAMDKTAADRRSASIQVEIEAVAA